MHFDLGLFVWTLITFALLGVLLARFAFNPLRAALDAREAGLRQILADAEKARADAQSLLTQHEAALRAARDEARRIIGEGQQAVTDMKRQSQERARADAEALVAQARTEIDRELQKSLDQLKGTVAGLSVRIARQVIKHGLDEQRHAELADEFIERLKQSHAIHPR